MSESDRTRNPAGMLGSGSGAARKSRWSPTDGPAGGGAVSRGGTEAGRAGAPEPGSEREAPLSADPGGAAAGAFPDAPRARWGLRRMFFVSLVAHLAGLAGYGVISAARFTPPETVETIPVSLVVLPAPAPVPPQLPTPPRPKVEESIPDPLETVKPKEEPPQKPPEIETKEPPVQKPPEEPPPEVPKERTGAVVDTVAVKPPPERPALGDDAPTTVEAEDPDFAYAYYLKMVRNKIASQWQPPFEVRGDGETSVVVRFRIQRNGQVDEVTVLEPSGVSVMDQSASRAVQLAKLPPLPMDYKESWLGVRLRFVR